MRVESCLTRCRTRDITVRPRRMSGDRDGRHDNRAESQDPSRTTLPRKVRGYADASIRAEHRRRRLRSGLGPHLGRIGTRARRVSNRPKTNGLQQASPRAVFLCRNSASFAPASDPPPARAGGDRRVATFIWESSNGRTTDFGSVNGGSSPSSQAVCMFFDNRSGFRVPRRASGDASRLSTGRDGFDPRTWRPQRRMPWGLHGVAGSNPARSGVSRGVAQR